MGGALWTDRPLILVRAESESGHVGWGEAAPLDGYGPDTMDDVLNAIATGGSTPSFDFGRDCAIASVEAQANGETFADRLGPLKRPLVSVASLQVRGGLNDPGPVAKVKIGRSSMEADLDAIRSLVDQFPDVRIRLDANGSSSRSDAMKLARSLEPIHVNIEFVEEPWASCFDADHRSIYPFAMAIDESLGLCSEKGGDWRNADICVLKPAISGPLGRQLDLMQNIRKSGRGLVLSSSWESIVGRSILLLIASRFEGPAIGLGFPDPFLEDIHAVPPALFERSIPVGDLSEIPGDSIRCNKSGLPIPVGSRIRVREITP